MVPVSIRDTYEALPPAKGCVRPKKVTIVFGKPSDPRGLEKHGEGEQSQDRIVRAVYQTRGKIEGNRS